MNVIFLGPISCGKGTQSNFVAEEYNLVHISIGELLRERRNIEDEVGLKIARLQKEGKLVDDDITLQVLEEKIEKCEKNKGILFDGYPRTIHQANLLDELLKKYNRKIDKVVNFEIEDEAIVDRISGRLVCKCGETYHRINKKPVKENICDKCGQGLYQRDDDTDEGVKKRLEIYHTCVFPLIDFYNNRNLLANVDALQSIEKVFADIKGILGGEK